jgi:hypothetical protein
MKKWLFCIALFAFMAPQAFSQERGFYIDAGLGFGGISYSGALGKFVDSVNKAADTRVTLDLDILTIGWAATENLYIVGTADRVADGFSDSDGNQFQIDILMFGIGTRYYPFERFLQLGLDLGVDILYMPAVPVPAISDPGFGAKLFAGFDFDPSPTGFTGILGGSLILNIIGGEPILAYMVSFKLAYKQG